MDRWMDGSIDRWTDRSTDVSTDSSMDRSIAGSNVGIDGLLLFLGAGGANVDFYFSRFIGRSMYGSIIGSIHGSMDRLINGSDAGIDGLLVLGSLSPILYFRK